MADVSIYVAAISAGAGIAGAVVTQVASAAKDARKDKLDRRERQADANRQACLDVLAAATELRAKVANTARQNSDGIEDRLAEIRLIAAGIQRHAASAALLAPASLAEPAQELAEAADLLAEEAFSRADQRATRGIFAPPEFTGFDQRISAFREAALTDARRPAKARQAPSLPAATQARAGGPGAPEQLR